VRTRSPRPSRRAAAAALTVLAALAATAVPAAAAPPVTVDVIDRHFDPTSSTLRVGGDIEWDFVATNKANHTSTDDSGLALWDSGVQAPGAVFTYTAKQSGSFPYHCTIHAEMVATLRVRDAAVPKSGTVATVFTIRWATALPADGAFDVQTRFGTAGAWTPFAAATTALDGPFSPGSGAGTYEFRSRTRNTVSAAVSGWSPALKIIVSA
jgi:plastocyanin